jgi:outer membrane protein assembly factor BamB
MKPRHLIRAAAVAIATFAPQLASAQLADSAWPKFQHDAQNTGRSDEHVGPLTQPSIVWEQDFKGPRRATPALAEDGTIYLGVGRKPLVAIDPANGSEIWGTSTGNTSQLDRSAPAVAADGTIYFGERSNDLWSVEPDGSTNWRFPVPTDGDVSTPSTIGPDGRIYMASDALGAGKFYSLNPNGTSDWDVNLGGAPINVSPALSPDGSVVYAVTGGRRLHALSTADGSDIFPPFVIQSAATGSRAFNFSPVVGQDGTIYVAARGVVVAVNPNGTEKWRFDPPTLQFGSPPALAADGGDVGSLEDALYVLGYARDSTIFALDPANGSILWQDLLANTGKARNTPPIVGADGTIYAGVKKRLFAFDPAGDGLGGAQTRWTMSFDNGFVSSPIIGGDGILYVGNGRALYKLSD